MLYQFGLVQFTVYPLNISDVSHATSSDWSRKEIAGAPTYREWVGEGDEEIHLKGKVFPHFFALHAAQRPTRGANDGTGMGHLDLLEIMRRLGQAHLLMRGDGLKLGWFVIERFNRGHSHIGRDGVGQQVDFEAIFQRVPVPDPSRYYADATQFGSR